MKLVTFVVCGGIALTARAAPAPTQPPALKCANVVVRFPEAPEPVYVLNGNAVDQDSLARVNADRIASIEVACTDEIYRRFGIKARRTGLIVFTSQNRTLFSRPPWTVSPAF